MPRPIAQTLGLHMERAGMSIPQNISLIRRLPTCRRVMSICIPSHHKYDDGKNHATCRDQVPESKANLLLDVNHSTKCYHRSNVDEEIKPARSKEGLKHLRSPVSLLGAICYLRKKFPAKHAKPYKYRWPIDGQHIPIHLRPPPPPSA